MYIVNFCNAMDTLNEPTDKLLTDPPAMMCFCSSEVIGVSEAPKSTILAVNCYHCK